MTCLAGASWVQSNILSRMTDPALRVLVVWVPFLNGTRGAINPSVFPDSRVTSLWDQNAHLQPVVLPARDQRAGPDLGLLHAVRSASPPTSGDG